MDGPEEAVDEIGDDTREEGELLEGEGISYVKEKDRHKLAIHQAHRVAVTVCSMLSFVRNRRHNSLQLQNAVRFLACGVSERTNEYLHFLGLTSSRQTALDALRALTSAAEERLKTVMALLPLRPALGPFVCIDNLDMQEKVHMSSIGHRSMMFHGTWGYVHMPSQELLDTLDGSKLDLTTYQKALNEVKTMDIDPALLMPSSEASEHYHWVMKSQIATALKKYLRKPLEQEGAIPTEPPVIDQISCKSPEIHMFKLMDESDNSAEGIGQVMEAIQIQSGLTPEEFFSRLQPMDADLGTCQNLKSLWDIRYPSDEPHNSLNNLVMQLGCSHTLWNIAQTIFTKHLGNSSNEDDLGAWRTLSSLGIAPEKVIQKKDFTAMIQHMEKVHESTLVLCLWKIINPKAKSELDPMPAEPKTIPTEEGNSIINKCYEKFCSPHARDKAAVGANPKLHNVLIRLHEFSTVIEANRAMKAGDVGRLINVWKIWSFMTHSLPGLTHYSCYLPRLVLLLTHILPESLSKLLRHNLLFSPSGQPSHFVAKDFFLENQNYWLKYFYNRGGIGTDVNRLKQLFSMNIQLWKEFDPSISQEFSFA
ncbi:hypothetical protein PCANC_17206 [Puccinia coronata f. sp. avenae]|uniref:DUF6589 domain-containing protein n=2 Tax=Puccinia coronata f. sp. avenae TaxID=200324 RepID=A0A2N5U274_9BASI|nr:hypothetical protein PCANC_17206 [Puccinia coronata f. sp. avenae]